MLGAPHVCACRDVRKLHEGTQMYEICDAILLRTIHTGFRCSLTLLSVLKNSKHRTASQGNAQTHRGIPINLRLPCLLTGLPYIKPAQLPVYIDRYNTVQVTLPPSVSTRHFVSCTVAFSNMLDSCAQCSDSIETPLHRAVVHGS